eukprot:Anaeramoba_ignava/a611618_15.p1 GENE.a611618_15~~a611618_15.p1  ORF type:complete len:141 (-),score=51.15 a611618_15:117-539(-)
MGFGKSKLKKKQAKSRNEEIEKQIMLDEKLEKVIIFNSDGEIIFSYDQEPINQDEIKEYLHAFDSYDNTVGKGFVLHGLDYVVYRFYDTLIYGRNGNEGEGPGICLYRFKKEEEEKESKRKKERKRKGKEREVKREKRRR